MFEFVNKIIKAKSLKDIFTKEEVEEEVVEFDASKATNMAKEAEERNERIKIEQYKKQLERDKKQIYNLIKLHSNDGKYYAEYEIRDLPQYPTTGEALIKSTIVKELRDKGFKVKIADYYRTTCLKIRWGE